MADWYGLDPNKPEEIKRKVSFLLKNGRYLCPPETRQGYDRRFEAPEIVNLIYRVWFQPFPSRITLEDGSSGIVKYVNPTMICFACTAMQHPLMHTKDGVIPLSGVKKLPFTQACEGMPCFLSGVYPS